MSDNDELRLTQQAEREFLKGTARERKEDTVSGYRYKYQKYVKAVTARNKQIEAWDDDEDNEVRPTPTLTTTLSFTDLQPRSL